MDWIDFYSDTFLVLYLGFFISLMEILFSIWGRIALGSNLSADALFKSGQTLVVNGPYSLVRNCFYSGITLGMIGSAIALGNASGLLMRRE